MTLAGKPSDFAIRYAMMRARVGLAVVGMIAVTALLGACGDAFTAEPTDAGSGGSGAGGTAGSGGGSGKCSTGQVLCSGVCVGRDDPKFGCGDSSCQPCNTSFGKAECNAGACVITECAQGHADCDLDPSNGCETFLNTANNCGSCGTTCPSGKVCANGNCADSCPAGQEVCNGACVDTVTDPNNCGTCGKACPTPMNATAGCAGGHCKYTCNTDYGDCNQTLADGCETPLNTPEHCTACNIACGIPAHATASCTSTGCAIVCDDGFGDCDANPANGCETDLTSDVAHCGSCSIGCASGGSPGCCNGACVDLQSDMNNCGDCGTLCPTGANANAACSNGVCELNCTGGMEDCDGLCATGCECPSGGCADAANSCSGKVTCSS